MTTSTDVGEAAFAIARHSLALAGLLFVAYLVVIMVLVALSSLGARR